MGGKFSRNKGKRNEFIVRDYFRERGYKADRVPLSGAAANYKGDVQVSGFGKEFKIEVKSRAKDFITVYRLFEKHKGEDNTLRFSLDGNVHVAMSPDFDSLNNGIQFFHIYTKDDTPVTELRTFRKILNLQRLLGECDYLAIRMNHSPILFLRFWGQVS